MAKPALGKADSRFPNGVQALFIPRAAWKVNSSDTLPLFIGRFPFD